MKKAILLFVLFIFICIFSILNHNKTYLKEDKLSIDILNRIKSSSTNNGIKDYKILQQRDVDTLRIILYSYTINNIKLVDCSVYEKTKNQRFRFVKGQQPSISTGNMLVSIGKFKSMRLYFMNFGFINDTTPNKYEVTYGNKTLIKEYTRNNSFLELYNLDNGGVEIRPIYESKVTQ